MARSMARPQARMILVALALAMLIPHLAATPQIAGAEIDTVAPTPPADFHVVSRTKSNMITLGWTPSYDAVGVAGYRLYRNGSWQGTLYQAGVDLLGPVMYDRLGGRIKTAVTYELIAFDAAGNDSTPATLEVAP